MVVFRCLAVLSLFVFAGCAAPDGAEMPADDAPEPPTVDVPDPVPDVPDAMPPAATTRPDRPEPAAEPQRRIMQDPFTRSQRGFFTGGAMYVGPSLQAPTPVEVDVPSPWHRISLPADAAGTVARLPALDAGGYDVLVVEPDGLAFWGVATFTAGNGTHVKQLLHRAAWDAEGPYAEDFLKYVPGVDDAIRVRVDPGDDVVLFARGEGAIDLVWRPAAGGVTAADLRSQADAWPPVGQAPQALASGVTMAVYTEIAPSLSPDAPRLVVRSVDPVTVFRDVILSRPSDLIDTGDGAIIGDVVPEGSSVDDVVAQLMQQEIVRVPGDRVAFVSAKADAGWSHVEAYGADPAGRMFQYGVQAALHGMDVDEQGTRLPAAPCAEAVDACPTPQAQEFLLEAGAQEGADVGVEMLWTERGQDLTVGHAHLAFDRPLQDLLARPPAQTLDLPGADADVGPTQTPRVAVPDLSEALQILEPIRAAAEQAAEDAEETVQETT